jgi:hypothetical protein
MTPDSRVVDISAEEARIRWGRQEFDFLAAVVSSSEAWLAFVADDVGFNGNSIPHFEVLDRRMDGQNNTRRFVPKDMCIFDDHRTNATSMPEVNIGTARVSRVLCKCFATHPQIPVLLIPIVTSPCFKLSPFRTLSREGSASATQSSCAGFVYTAMFALEDFSIATLGISVAEGAMTTLVLVFLSRSYITRGKIESVTFHAGILSTDLCGMRERRAAERENPHRPLEQ